MANEAWVTIFGTNSLSIEAGEVTIRRGLGIHQLIIPIAVRPTNEVAYKRIFSFDGYVDIDGLNGGGGYLGHFPRTQPYLLQANGKIPSYLVVDLSIHQINEIEARRSIGFNLNVNIQIHADNGEFSSTQISGLHVSREKWIQLLDQIGFRKTLLVELSVPDGMASPEMEKAISFFANAQRRFLEGENRQTVECLRQALAALIGQEDSLFEEEESSLELAVGKEMKSRGPYANRFELTRRTLKFLTDLGAHPEVDETGPREARAALTMTAGLLQWYLVKP